MAKTTFNTPVGPLLLIADISGITEIKFISEDNLLNNTANHPVLEEAKRQLEEYFQGNRTSFDLPVNPSGTPFQESVWKELQHIPYGTTATYSEVSNKLNKPKAVRAVGHANGLNPIPIIIPCHRVIGANQTLTGYAGGIEKKRWLLQHEGALLL